jgi:hypothetical protein
MTVPSRKRKASRRASWSLQTPGWTDPVRERLEEILRKGAGRRLPVVFDFDNTLVCGDIGEATLAVLVLSGLVDPDLLPTSFFPAFRPSGRGLVTLDASPDLTAYYDAFLAPTAHGETDPTPLANGYALAVEVMEGLTPFQVAEAARRAYQFSRVGEVRPIEVTPGKTSFPAPFFYPEMVELLAKLIQHDFDVWIVSASNVWSVRWMVLKALPPLLRRHGVNRTIPPGHVLGISTLLADSKCRLFKDPLLIQEAEGYANLNPSALRRVKLTSRLHFPVSTYSGKIACILDCIGSPPYLCVGDSPGDLPMMKFSENRLWIARLEKPDYQRAAVDAMKATRRSSWVVQPTLTKVQPGFLADPALVRARLKTPPAPVAASMAVWRGVW